MKQELTKELLEKLYLVENKSSGTIAKELGYGKTWIGKKLREFGLTERKSKEQRQECKLDNMAKTNLERYGSISPFGNKEVQRKAINTLKERYNTHTPYQIHLSDRTKNIINSKEEMKKYLESFDSKPTLYKIVDDLKITHSAINKRIREYGLEHLVEYYPMVNQYESEIQNLLNEWGIVCRKDRTILNPLEIDLYCPDFKIGIEFNGNHWHTVDQKGKNYHQEKSLLAQERGVFLYHIFEYEWLNKKEQVISQLRNLFNLNEQRIYARECIIKEVAPKEAKEFLDLNHLQGYDKAPIRIGLYFENRLVSIMTFGKPRFNKQYEYELLRFCCKTNVSVIGGASKLFNYFIKNYHPENILSYSNIAHTKGKLYSLLNFKEISRSNPNYVWVKGEEFLTRYQCQKHKLLKQFPEYKNLTETDIMTSLGYEKLEDAGNITWLWTNRINIILP